MHYLGVFYLTFFHCLSKNHLEGVKKISEEYLILFNQKQDLNNHL